MPITRLTVRYHRDEQMPVIVIEPKVDPDKEPLTVDPLGTKPTEAWRKGYRRAFGAQQYPTAQAFALLIWAAEQRRGKSVQSKNFYELPVSSGLPGWELVKKAETVTAAVYRIVGHTKDRDELSEVLEQKNGNVRIKPGLEVEIGTSEEERALILRWMGVTAKVPDVIDQMPPPPADEVNRPGAPQPERPAEGSARSASAIDEELRSLQAKVEEGIRASPEISVLVAEAFNLPTPARATAEELAHTLLHTRGSGKVVAAMLNDENPVLDQGQDSFRDLLIQILTLVVDWRPMVLAMRAALAGSNNTIELPLRTETLIEIVTAGAEGRRPLFGPKGALPQGTARVRMPPGPHAPLFQRKGLLLVDAIIVNLCREGEIDDKRLAELGGHFTNKAELKLVVRRTMKKRREKPSPHRPPFYFVVIDAELGTDAWAVVRDTLGKEVPELRLVRLTGGIEALDDEIDVVESVKDYLENRRGRKTS